MQELIHVRAGTGSDNEPLPVPGVKFTNGHGGYQVKAWTSCNDAVNDDMTPDRPASSVRCVICFYSLYCQYTP